MFRAPLDVRDHWTTCVMFRPTRSALPSFGAGKNEEAPLHEDFATAVSHSINRATSFGNRFAIFIMSALLLLMHGIQPTRSKPSKYSGFGLIPHAAIASKQSFAFHRTIGRAM